MEDWIILNISPEKTKKQKMFMVYWFKVWIYRIANKIIYLVSCVNNYSQSVPFSSVWKFEFGIMFIKNQFPGMYRHEKN